MNCSEAKIFLGHRDLKEEEEAALKSHIESCPACREEASEYHALHAITKELAHLSLPVDDEILEHSIRREVLRKIPERDRPALSAMPFALKVAASFILLFTVALFSYVYLDGNRRGAVPLTSIEEFEGDSSEPGAPVDLQLRKNGGVTLTWDGLEKGRYKVLVSRDPANFTASQSEFVTGSTWKDRGGPATGVIFYKVIEAGEKPGRHEPSRT